VAAELASWFGLRSSGLRPSGSRSCAALGAQALRPPLDVDWREAFLGAACLETLCGVAILEERNRYVSASGSARFGSATFAGCRLPDLLQFSIDDRHIRRSTEGAHGFVVGPGGFDDRTDLAARESAGKLLRTVVKRRHGSAAYARIRGAQTLDLFQQLARSDRDACPNE
jgi:hypothetical protein